MLRESLHLRPHEESTAAHCHRNLLELNSLLHVIDAQSEQHIRVFPEES